MRAVLKVVRTGGRARESSYPICEAAVTITITCLTRPSARPGPHAKIKPWIILHFQHGIIQWPPEHTGRKNRGDSKVENFVVHEQGTIMCLAGLFMGQNCILCWVVIKLHPRLSYLSSRRTSENRGRRVLRLWDFSDATCCCFC